MAVQKDEKQTDGDNVDPDVDHGYAWVILAGCFMMYSLVIGTIKAYGILYTEMVSYYGTGSGNTAWIGSMVLLLLLGLSPVANSFSRKFSFRRVAFAGGLLLCLGYFLSGFVPKMEIMYLTMGGCAGLGYGLSFSPCSTIISYYFKKHRALANGIVVSGSGIGALTYPAIYSFLIKKYGLHGAFWVIGGILLNVCVAACVFKQPKLLLKEKESQESTGSRKDQELLLKKGIDKQKSKDTLTNCYGLDFRFSLFRNPRFSMYCVSFVLCMNGYGNNLIMIPAHIKDVGYDTTHAVYGVTIMGGCEVFARIAFGLIADRNIMKRKHIFLFSMLIASVFSFIAPFFDSFFFLGYMLPVRKC
ncbi:monocarboxylate transporter 2-like [Ruditapes philippinarum]|uniref:monocarboxylate transporter 2-like n=1 Tax=Ruditapes philippinarum TaxID=129788 RepID=UPI00295BCFC8|nr:monocarboxylate transporter 2-like [Ruditapes philippinarum]